MRRPRARRKAPSRAPISPTSRPTRRGEYLADWLAGPRDKAAVERKVARVAELTGLPAEAVRRYGGDLSEEDFLRERGRLLGAKFAFYDATLSAGATAPGLAGRRGPRAARLRARLHRAP